jgi:hypothetical protein
MTHDFTLTIRRHLIGKDPDILVERIERADISWNRAGMTRCDRRQLTLLEYQRQQRKHRMTKNVTCKALVQFISI